MANPRTSNPAALPEFMTSPSVADFFVEWLGEQIQHTEARARDEGNSRALGWELRTLTRAHTALSSFVAELTADVPATEG